MQATTDLETDAHRLVRELKARMTELQLSPGRGDRSVAAVQFCEKSTKNGLHVATPDSIN